MKDTGVQDLSPESCNKPSGDIFVFRYLFCRKKAWYTEQNNLEFVEKNPMEEKTYRTRCGTIHYWASVSNLNLFKFAATKGNLSAVDGIFQNGPNQCCAEKGKGTVLTGEFLKTVGLQIFGKTICTCVRIYILLKNRAYGRGFIFVDLQHTVNQTIAIRRKTAVLAAFSCLVHCLLVGHTAISNKKALTAHG